MATAQVGDEWRRNAIKMGRRAAAAALAMLGGTVLAVGCGESTQAKFETTVERDDTPNDIYERSLTAAAEICIEKPTLEAVFWSFSKDDVEKPVVQQYINKREPSLPMYLRCSALASRRAATDDGGGADGAPVETNG